MELFQLWYVFHSRSIHVQIKNIGFSRRVGRPRTDYGAFDNEYSAWKSYDSMAKYQSIQSHSLALQAPADTRCSLSMHTSYLPTPPTEQHTQLSFPVHKLVIPAIAFSIPIVLIPPPPPSSLRRCPLNSI